MNDIILVLLNDNNIICSSNSTEREKDERLNGVEIFFTDNHVKISEEENSSHVMTKKS